MKVMSRWRQLLFVRRYCDNTEKRYEPSATTVSDELVGRFDCIKEFHRKIANGRLLIAARDLTVRATMRSALLVLKLNLTFCSSLRSNEQESQLTDSKYRDL
jgi:hypothetical protein